MIRSPARRTPAGILERVGFDNAVERGGVKKALSKSTYDASDIVGKLVKYAVMLFALVIAFNVFGPNPINDLPASSSSVSAADSSRPCRPAGRAT